MSHLSLSAGFPAAADSAGGSNAALEGGAVPGLSAETFPPGGNVVVSPGWGAGADFKIVRTHQLDPAC